MLEAQTEDLTKQVDSTQYFLKMNQANLPTKTALGDGEFELVG